MGLSAAGGIVARPAAKASRTAPKYLLEDVVPKQFGDWRELPEQGAQLVNPQTKELLDSLYSQMLNRTYVNSKGYRIMLALAYGDDQRGGLQAHKPEVCYPAQGFKLLSNEGGAVSTPFGSIPAKRLNTSLTSQRIEPVTYWLNVGDTAITNKLEKRIVEMKLGLTGQVPDGLLFRISSIDSDTPRAFAMHDAFASDLLSAVSPVNRGRLSGLAGPTGATGPG